MYISFTGISTKTITPSVTFSLLTPLITAVLILNEDQEFAAIQAIHGQLDDNADGSVDLSESSEVWGSNCHQGMPLQYSVV